MKKAIRVLVTFVIILFVLFLLLLATNFLGCHSEERVYFKVHYPNCVVDIVERTKLHTKAVVNCRGEKPELVTIRRK